MRPLGLSSAFPLQLWALTSLWLCLAALSASLAAHMVKNVPAMQETQDWSLGWEDPLEEVMAIHSSILVWRIPWTEEPGGYSPWGRSPVTKCCKNFSLSPSCSFSRTSSTSQVSFFLDSSPFPVEPSSAFFNEGLFSHLFLFLFIYFFNLTLKAQPAFS